MYESIVNLNSKHNLYDIFFSTSASDGKLLSIRLLHYSGQTVYVDH